MGRKPLFAVAGIMLAGLAMTGCQQTRADKTLKQPWPPTPQKNTTSQGWNRQPVGGTNGLPKTNTNGYPQGSYQGMNPSGGLPTGQNSYPQGMGIPSSQNNVQRVTTPLSPGYSPQSMNNPYQQNPGMGMPQQSSAGMGGQLPGPLPTPTARINPPANPYSQSATALNRNQQIIPGPVPVHGSSSELDLPTPAARQDLGSPTANLPAPPAPSSVNFPGGLQTPSSLPEPSGI